MFPILTAPWTETLVWPEPLEQMAYFLALLPSSYFALEFCKTGREMGSAVFQLPSVYTAILVVEILKCPAVTYPLSSLHAPFSSGCFPLLEQTD